MDCYWSTSSSSCWKYCDGIKGTDWLCPMNSTGMMTSSNGNIFRVTGHLCGEFTGPGEFPAQRPVTRSFDVFFDLSLNKRLSKQPWGWWFETPSWSLWHHCNGKIVIMFHDIDTNIEYKHGSYLQLTTTSVLRANCRVSSVRTWTVVTITLYCVIQN